MKRTTIKWLAALLCMLLATTVACGEDEIGEGDNINDPRQVDNQHDNDPDDNDDNDNQTGECEDVDCDGDQICNPETGECVDCLEDDDCADRYSCDQVSNTCIEDDPAGCVDDDDCGDDVCDTDTEECVPCLDHEDCPEGDVCDADQNQCMGCLDDEHCDEDETCDTDVNACVVDDPEGCTDDGECPDGVCDTSTNDCVPCLINDDCDDDVCDTDNDPNQCIPCLGDNHCTDGVCDTDNDQCVDCTDNDDCTDGVCDTDNDQCVTCLDNDDCTDGVCDTDNDQCLPCMDDDDCTDGVCDTDNDQCVDCTDNDDCDEANEVCDTDTNSCVVDDPDYCTDNDDCTDGVCDTDNDQCVDCLEDDDCGDDACDTDTNSCVPCTDNDDCTDGDVCDTDDNQCVTCIDDTDCTDGVCDTANDQCVDCLEDGDCAVDEQCDTTDNACEIAVSFAADEVPIAGDVQEFSGHGYDFAIDGDQPFVGVLDYVDDEVYVFDREDGSWFVDTAAELTELNVDTDEYSDLRLEIDDDGMVHIVVAGLERLVYIQEQTDVWNAQVLHTLGDGYFWSADIAIGNDGAVHKMGGIEDGFYYERLSADGSTLVQQHHLLDTDETVRGIDMEIRPNNEPMMLLTMDGDDDVQILAPEDASFSQWDGGSIGTATGGDFPTLAIDGNDVPWAILSPENTGGIESWRHTGGAWDDWDTETLSTGPAALPWIALATDDSPHISFSTDDPDLTYARDQNSAWVEYLVDDLDVLADSRIDVDAGGDPHVVGLTDVHELHYYETE